MKVINKQVSVVWIFHPIVASMFRVLMMFHLFSPSIRTEFLHQQRLILALFAILAVSFFVGLLIELFIYIRLGNSSTVNSSLSLDSDTVIVQVLLLATSQTASSFDLSLANLVPMGQSALTLITSSFTSGVAGVFGNVN